MKPLRVKKCGLNYLPLDKEVGEMPIWGGGVLIKALNL